MANMYLRSRLIEERLLKKGARSTLMLPGQMERRAPLPVASGTACSVQPAGLSFTSGDAARSFRAVSSSVQPAGGGSVPALKKSVQLLRQSVRSVGVQCSPERVAHSCTPNMALASFDLTCTTAAMEETRDCQRL